MGVKVKFEEFEAIPAGSYVAKLLDVKEKDGGPFGDGKMLIWEFLIVDGYTPGIEELVGEQVGGVTGLKATPNSKLFKFLKGFGIEGITGEEIDTDSAKNKVVRIRVSENPKKPERTSVDGVAPYDPNLQKHRGIIAAAKATAAAQATAPETTKHQPKVQPAQDDDVEF
jgi:hypothetical protein